MFGLYLFTFSLLKTVGADQDPVFWACICMEWKHSPKTVEETVETVIGQMR